MKKQHQILFNSLVVLAVLCVGVFANFKIFTIYPIEHLIDYEIGTYHEDLDSNWTEAQFEIVDEKIVFSYQLSADKEEPFAAFYFRDKSIDSNLIDLKDYNSFSVYLKAEKAQKIPVTLRFRNDSLIKLSKSFPEISVTTVIDYTTAGLYTVELKEFEIATWWLRYHGIEKETIDLKQLTQLKYLAIGSCMALEPGSSDVILIDQVKFYNDYSMIWMGLGLVFTSLFVFLYMLGKQKKSKKTIVVEHIEVEDKSDLAHKKVVLIKNFIGRNFSDANFSMYHVQQELKLSASEVRKIFKDDIKDSFKAYLKTVRISEVKRLLLLDSDLTISEIAYKCGFSDIPYFNRLFKKEVGSTPKDFKNSKN